MQLVSPLKIKKANFIIISTVVLHCMNVDAIKILIYLARKCNLYITCSNNVLGEETFIAFKLRLFSGIPTHLNCIFMFKTAVIVYPISIYEKEVTRKMI